MKANQKYSQEFMYAKIEDWQKSELSQMAWCKQEGISVNTFRYWLHKHQTDKLCQHKGFIPVTISDGDKCTTPMSDGIIHIIYPNGVEVYCPIGIDNNTIHNLIKY